MKQELTAPGQTRRIPLSLIDPSPFNRAVEDDDVVELAQSMRVKLHAPVKGRPVKDRIELVFGHRRVKAAQLNGWTEIDCIVEDMTDDEVIQAQIAENVQRQDPHPMVIARNIHQVRGDGPINFGAIATKLALSENFVRKIYVYINLLPELQDAFIFGALHPNHAFVLARLNPNDQLEAFDYVTHPKGLSVKAPNGSPIVRIEDLQEWVKRTALIDLSRAPFKLDDANLLPIAGPCMSCPKRVGANPILFPDVQQGDTCTDRRCLNDKIENFIAKSIADDSTLRKVSREQTSAFEDALCLGAWSEIRDGDGRTPDATAIVVSGYDRGRVIPIEIESEKKRRQKEARKANPTTIPKKVEQKSNDEKLKARLELFENINGLQPMVTSETFLPIARGLTRLVPIDIAKRILERRGVEIPEGANPNDLLDKCCLDITNVPDLHRFVAELAFSPDIYRVSTISNAFEMYANNLGCTSKFFIGTRTGEGVESWYQSVPIDHQMALRLKGAYSVNLLTRKKKTASIIRFLGHDCTVGKIEFRKEHATFMVYPVVMVDEGTTETLTPGELSGQIFTANGKRYLIGAPPCIAQYSGAFDLGEAPKPDEPKAEKTPRKKKE